MLTDALSDEKNARRECWKLQRIERSGLGNYYEKSLFFQRKDSQITKHRKTAHKLTVCYNNDEAKLRKKQPGPELERPSSRINVASEAG